MKTDNLAMMEKDAKLYGRGVSKKIKFLAFLALALPAIICWATIWRLRDAMIAGLSLSSLYLGLSVLHWWKIDKNMWRYVIKRDFSGNSYAKILYYFWFCLIISLVLSALSVPYFAYISWGPDTLKLPMPYVKAKLDLIYYFWLIILYLIIVPASEIMFFFVMQQLTWTPLQGQILIPLSYGALNYMWIVTCVKGDGWRAALIILFTLFGFIFYWAHYKKDIFRTIGLRTCLSLTTILVLLWLFLLDKPVSPNNFYKGDSENYFYENNVKTVQDSG